MLEILYQYFNKTKYRIIAGAAAVLYIQGTLENVQKAKTIRENVVDIDRIRQLHDKYKR